MSRSNGTQTLSVLFFSLAVATALTLTSCRAKDEVVTAAGAKSPSSAEISNLNRWMALVGDSGVTGAVASPRLQLRLDELGKFLVDDHLSNARKEDIPEAEKYGIREDSPAPLTRVLFSNHERSQTDAQRLQVIERAAQKLDINQYSWGYLAGRRLGIKPSDMVMVAQNGTRVDSLATQFQRIKDVAKGPMPPLILISFNANDLCDEAVLTQPTAELVKKYEDTVRSQMETALKDAQAHSQKTTIVAMAPLNVAQVISNPELLSQKVNLQGRDIECRNLRDGSVQGMLAQETRHQLLGMCKAVLETKPDDAVRIRAISDLSEGFSAAWERMVRDFNQAYASKGFQFEFSDATRRVGFQNGDLANDCFHPGAKAHAKIADGVIEVLGKLPILK